MPNPTTCIARIEPYMASTRARSVRDIVPNDRLSSSRTRGVPEAGEAAIVGKLIQLQIIRNY
jgi:hypothetical protein